MKDEILERIWKVKEEISKEAPDGFANLASLIKQEAAKVKKTYSIPINNSYPLRDSEIMRVHEDKE